MNERHGTSVEMLLAGVALADESPQAALLTLLGAAEAVHATSSGLRRREIKNSPLRRKLEHLAEQVGFEDVLLAGVDASVWAEQVAGLRSTFTHSGRVGAGTAAELSLLIRMTAAVVVLTLLHELGVDPGRDRARLRRIPLLRDVVRDRPRGGSA